MRSILKRDMDIRQTQEYTYQVGSCLALNHPTYVIRPADQELFDALKAGEFCYVLSSPQTGKSSLQNRTIALLQAENIICISLDMTRVNHQILTLEEWYNQIILTLENSFKFSQYIPDLWWENTKEIPADEKLMMFIEEVLLVNTKDKKIVIFIDEVNDDSIVNTNFSSLGILIEYCLQERVNNPDFHRLTFALLGTTVPKNLVSSCKYIELNDFTIETVIPLVKGLESIVKEPLKVIQEILYWSGGQPFLTQKLCQILVNYLGERGKEENYNDIALVADLVKICVIENWESQDQPSHLTKISNSLVRNITKSTRHLEIYQQILRNGKFKLPKNSQQSKTDVITQWEIKELLMSGVAKIHQGFLKVYNPIYAEIFNEKWIQKHLQKVTKLTQATNHQETELNGNQKIAKIDSEVKETQKINPSSIKPKTKQVIKQEPKKLTTKN